MIRDGIKLSAVFLLFTLISWYGNINHVSVDTTIYDIEVDISYDQAVKLLEPPVYKKNRYFYKLSRKQEYHRTMVPFKYEKKKPYRKKIYYVINN